MQLFNEKDAEIKMAPQSNVFGYWSKSGTVNDQILVNHFGRNKIKLVWLNHAYKKLWK